MIRWQDDIMIAWYPTPRIAILLLRSLITSIWFQMGEEACRGDFVLDETRRFLSYILQTFLSSLIILQKRYCLTLFSMKTVAGLTSPGAKFSASFKISSLTVVAPLALMKFHSLPVAQFWGFSVQLLTYPIHFHGKPSYRGHSQLSSCGQLNEIS